MISEVSFMATELSASSLPWIWVIETLASSNEIDTSLLIDLVKQTPPNARELVSLRVLENLFVQDISNANHNASLPGDIITFHPVMHCEDVLRRLLLEVSSDRKMVGPEVSEWDVHSFITKKRSCLPKCALQQIKDAILDSTNPFSASLKAKSGLEIDNCSGDGGCSNAVDLNGVKQSHEVRGTDVQHQHVLPSGNATQCVPDNTVVMQENQPRTLVPSKRSINAHEGEHNESEPKKIKQEVIRMRSNVVHDFESSQREGVASELSAGIPQALVREGNLEIGALVGGLDGNRECVASEMVRLSVDSSIHDEHLPQRMVSDEKIKNVGSRSKAHALLRTSSGSSQQVIHQDSCFHGTEDQQECNQGDLFKDEPSKGAKRNTVGSDEPEFSSDSDGYHHKKTGLSAKRNDFVNSQCTQGQDSLATETDRELSLCMRCNESGQLLVCSSHTCPLVVHQSCLGSVPSFDNRGNFYCPFCAYSRAISEYLEGKKMASLARKDLSAFVGFGARRQLKTSSRRTKQNQSREDEKLCHDKNNKDNLNEVTEARHAPVSRHLDGEVMELPSPQAKVSVPHEPVAAGQKSKNSPPRLHESKQKLWEEGELCRGEKSNENSLNETQKPGNSPVNKSSANAEVTQIDLPRPEAFAPPNVVTRKSSVVEESFEDEQASASKNCMRFRKANKN